MHQAKWQAYLECGRQDGVQAIPKTTVNSHDREVPSQGRSENGRRHFFPYTTPVPSIYSSALKIQT
jgi:hypothetical protein